MSGHWYDEDGIRYDTVEGSKGQPVKPDIRHARKYDLAPGVTTIIRCASSEPLIRWREERVLKVAQQNPREIAEEEPDYVARILRTAKEQAEETMSAGSEIHQLVEDRLLDPECDHPTILSVLERLEPISDQRPLPDWRSEHPAVSYYGFATRADLFLPPKENPETPGVLLDIKTKDGSCAEQRIYDEHAMQLAATREALGWRGAEINGFPRVSCGILFVSRDIPGDIKLVMLDEDRLIQGWKMFRALLLYWQTKNQHTPTWASVSLPV
jgi:hypothetical protein